MPTLDFYHAHYHDLFEPLLDLMRTGVRIDTSEAARIRATLLDECAELRGVLDEITEANTCVCACPPGTHVETDAPLALTKAGKPRKRQPKALWPCEVCDCTNFTPRGYSIFGENDLSSQKVIRYLYTTLGLPKRRMRGEEGLSANEVILRKLRILIEAWIDQPKGPAKRLWQREPEQAARALSALLTHRELAKLATFVQPSALDDDGRLRCTFLFTTITGRLAARRNPYDTGMNLQTIPRPRKGIPNLRSIFLPERGHVWLEVDYSQGESRLVDVLTGDPAFIARANARPGAFDGHTFQARRIFACVLGIPESEVEVTKDRRQLAKPVKHGSNYGAHGKTMSDTLLKEGVILSPRACDNMINAAKERPIEAWKASVRKRVMRDRMLTTSWGRELHFTYDRLNDDTYRRAYAFQPQSELGDDLNQMGLIPLYNFILSEGLTSRIRLAVHDSLLVSCPPEEVHLIASFLKQSMERERLVNGHPLIIPIEYKLGSTWACEKEFKELPNEDELFAAAKEVLRA